MGGVIMTIYAHLTLTVLLEAAIKSFNNHYKDIPSEHWGWEETSFCAAESYLYDFRQKVYVQDIKHSCKLVSDLDAINLLFIYIILTRQPHKYAVVYEWKESYTCRQLTVIPNYFGTHFTPLHSLYGIAKNGNTPEKDRITDFDKKCAEYAQILGMTPKQGGNSV